MTTPTPSIGRIVHHIGPDGKTRAAIVTHVWSDTCVNCMVFGKDGSDTVAGLKTSVNLHPHTPEHPEVTDSWHWMPYQLQQHDAGTAIHAPPTSKATKPK